MSLIPMLCPVTGTDSFGGPYYDVGCMTQATMLPLYVALGIIIIAGIILWWRIR